MPATTTTDPRKCPDCVMLRHLCLCALVPGIVTTTRLCLIIQRREVLKSTNTGALAVKSLVNSEMHIRGLPGAALDFTAMLDDAYENLFLFPAKESQPLTKDFVAGVAKPVKLFVADGSWSQGIKIHRRFAKATGIQTVHLPVGAPTQYKLRKESGRPEGLATMEAIARAFALLEGEAVAEELLRMFRIRVDRILWARGQLSAAAVFGGLPLR